MKIVYNGHACFSIETSSGTIVTDPFGEEIPYPVGRLKGDIVTVSHEHFDHNAIKRVEGNPHIIRNLGEYSFSGVKIKGVSAFHDKNRGKQRGQITIFVIEAEGMRLCHLGDLGELLNEEQIKAIGNIDILFVPTGGFFTIEPEEAQKVVKQINPYIAIPMHYRTNYIKDWNIKPIDTFLKDIPFPVKLLDTNYIEMTKESLPKNTEVYILKI
jgi:L-ascorbate metabolism protein UlaG (beta-lactamase superfamily)